MCLVGFEIIPTLYKGCGTIFDMKWYMFAL
jgi:hypothetical protein